MDDLISKLSEIRSNYNCLNEAEEPYYRALSEAIKKLSERVDGDTISRRMAIDAADKIIERDTSGSNAVVNAMIAWSEYIRTLPSAQPEHADCIYCHEDSDGYVKPIEKNCHAFIRFGMNGWCLELCAKGWHGDAKINYCPMCGRELNHG